MGITNKSINFYRKSVSVSGSVTRTLIDSYDVWWEPAEVTRWQPGEVIVGKGLIFLFDEIDDLWTCSVQIEGEYFDIVGVSRFFDRKGNFHHAECTYR